MKCLFFSGKNINIEDAIFNGISIQDAIFTLTLFLDHKNIERNYHLQGEKKLKIVSVKRIKMASSGMFTLFVVNNMNCSIFTVIGLFNLFLLN